MCKSLWQIDHLFLQMFKCNECRCEPDGTILRTTITALQNLGKEEEAKEVQAWSSKLWQERKAGAVGAVDLL